MVIQLSKLLSLKEAHSTNKTNQNRELTCALIAQAKQTSVNYEQEKTCLINQPSKHTANSLAHGNSLSS